MMEVVVAGHLCLDIIPRFYFDQAQSVAHSPNQPNLAPNWVGLWTPTLRPED